ncbi:hypothetical protein KR044_010770, partial [Drosophila immigrans]
FSRILLKLLGGFLTVYVCILSSERYFKYWVQTTIERTDVHISEIAFPAVTICPTHLTLSSLNCTNNKKNQDSSRLNRLYNMVHSIQLNPRQNAEADVDYSDFQDFYNQSLSDIGQALAHDYKCEELFNKCMWRRRQVDCCSIFKNFGAGISCYIFNSQHAKDADRTWPWSVAGSGFNSGLNVKMNRYVGEHRLESVGVVLQEPSQYLGSSVTYSSDDRIVVPLQPQRFTAEAGVRARPVEMRYCWFEEELEEINELSRSECIHSCHVHYMEKMCQCHYMLHMAIKNNWKDTRETHLRPCSVQDLPCFAKHKVSFFSMSNIIEESSDNIFNTTDCKCYPNCDHIQYHASIYTDRLSTAKSNGLLEVDVYFQEETLFSYRSTLQITLLDLMVSFGGIAGLFLGYSVMGFINALMDRIACCGQPSHRS